MDEELNHGVLEDTFTVRDLQRLILPLKAHLFSHELFAKLLAAIMRIDIEGVLLLKLLF